MKNTRSIVIEDELWNRLSELAESKYMSISALIRQAIAEKLEKEGESK